MKKKPKKYRKITAKIGRDICAYVTTYPDWSDAMIAKIVKVKTKEVTKYLDHIWGKPARVPGVNR